MPEAVRILVLVTARASPDGVTVHTYLAGETYGPDSDPPMQAGLAATFLREGWGERYDGDGGDASRVHAPALGGGPAQRFCSDACRAAFHRGARRWAVRELEVGRLDIADLRNA